VRCQGVDEWVVSGPHAEVSLGGDLGTRDVKIE